MPPISLGDMLDILRNPNFKTYLVMGSRRDKAWQLAIAAQNILPAVRTYLVMSAAQSEVRQHFHVHSGHVAIVFGRDDKPAKTLTEKQAKDFLKVAVSICEA
jgi:hypothetical protein